MIKLQSVIAVLVICTWHRTATVFRATVLSYEKATTQWHSYQLTVIQNNRWIKNCK